MAASDANGGSGAKKRDATSSPSEKELLASPSRALLAVGDAVRVQSAEDKSAFLAATIVRRHMSGEYTVEYNDSGKTERYVKRERLQSTKKQTLSTAKAVAFEPGDRVLYRHRRQAEEEEEETKKMAKWRDGVVKICRHDGGGAVDIVDTETQKVVKRVAMSDVKRVKDTSGGGRGRGGDGDAEEDAEEEEDEFAVGDVVEFQKTSKSKTWRRGRVDKKRKDGTFDIGYTRDGEEEMAVKVAGTRMRKTATATTKPKSNPKHSGSEEDEDAEDSSPSIRKRTKSKAKRRALNQSEEEEEEEASDDDDEEDADHGRRRRRPPAGAVPSSSSARRGVRFEQLRLHQLVEFRDDDGRVHRGYVKLLRRDDRACDIEHDSDTERISKRVPAAQITPVTMLSRLWRSRAMASVVVFALNARVFYRTRDGLERKGFVVKIHRESSACVYDIEDEIEGDVVRKVPAAKLRAVPWLNYSLPGLPGLPGLPSMPQLPGLSSWTVLRKGMHVRVRRRDGDDDHDDGKTKTKTKKTPQPPRRVYWQDGVVLRVKSDATCVVECLEADGVTRTKRTVKNGDVRPRFGFPGLPGLPTLPGLSLPTLQMPQALLAPKSAVEVLAESKNKVFLGTIVAVDEAEKTYTVLYTDGRKEKRVASHRVRLCLRKLRIGTEVEMVVEGPCKEVSKLDGEVAWIHRNEKVAVRINGGNNDVFAEVCTHALMVDGQPAFAAPLSSTWLELWAVYANVALETLVFVWFCFGLCVEIGDMARLRDDTTPESLRDARHMAQQLRGSVDWHACAVRRQLEVLAAPGNATMALPSSQQYVAIPASAMATDRAWLLALILLKVLLTLACVALSCRLVQNKISALQDNYIDVKEYQRDRVLRRHFARVMGVCIAVCFVTLLLLASLLNRLEYFCLFRADELKFDTLALTVNVFAVHTEYQTTVELLQSLAAKSVFNLFRGVALHVLVFAFPGNSGFLQRLFLWLPLAIAVTALVGAMGVAALHIFYYVQRVEMLEHATLTLTPYVDWAVVATLVALWFNATIVRLVAAMGSFYETVHTRHASSHGDLTDEIIDQAERGEFGLQAKQEALYSRVELKQEQLGVCKLSVLRVQRHLLFHVGSMILGIIATSTLRGRVAEDASVAHAALTLHLVVCIVWLVLVLLASLVSIVVKREAPELMAYILDV